MHLWGQCDEKCSRDSTKHSADYSGPSQVAPDHRSITFDVFHGSISACSTSEVKHAFENYRSKAISMAEMTMPGEDHGDASGIGCGDHFLITH
jgi:hypothetical protein